jgi:hypothetical protein
VGAGVGGAVGECVCPYCVGVLVVGERVGVLVVGARVEGEAVG